MRYVNAFLGVLAFFVLLTEYFLPLYFAPRNTDFYLHDTYYVGQQIHYLLLGVVLAANCGVVNFVLPRIMRRAFPQAWGTASTLILLIGFHMTFFPQALLGFWNAHRRYHAYNPEFKYLNFLSTMGAVVLLSGFLFPLFCLIWWLTYGRRRTDSV